MKRDLGKKAVLKELLKTPVIEVACSKAGIGKTSFYEWKNSDPEFTKAVDEAMKTGINFISDIAESQLINFIKDGNFKAVAFWLKHNRSERYGEKVQLSGFVGIREELTDEEYELIERAMRHINGIN
jgi:hypothetical protein